MEKKNGKRILSLMLTVCLLLFSGCAKGGDGNTPGEGFLGTKQEHPADTPWNHGSDAILETENGWYTCGQVDGVLCLRYYDKETGNSILLCNKPECTHDGDDQCEATYQSLQFVNGVLYDGYLYVLGWQGLDLGAMVYEADKNRNYDVINLSLYRAALDGSAMDKVGTVFEADNLQHQKVKSMSRSNTLTSYGDNSFIIHKGYAYIPYYLQLGSGSVGLRGGGIAKMDLNTGMTEVITECDTLQKGIPACLSATSDYVYFYRSDRNVSRVYPWYRYVISENQVEAVEPSFSDPNLVVFGREHVLLSAVPCYVGDTSYWLARSKKEGEEDRIAVLAFQVSTGEMLSEECFLTEIPFQKKKYNPTLSPRINGFYTMTYHDDKFLIADADAAYFYDGKGQQVGRIAVPKEELEIKDAEKGLYIEFKICNEKLYLIYANQGFYGTGYYYRVLQSPLEDVYKEQGEWKDAYRIQGMQTWEEHLEYMQKLEPPQGP